MLGVSLLSLAAILGWQFWNSPQFEGSSHAQRANAEVHQAIEQTGFAQLVEANVRFTRAKIAGQHTLLTEIYVQRQPRSTLSGQQIRDRLTQTIQTRLLNQEFNVTPLVSMTVLEAPKVESAHSYRQRLPFRHFSKIYAQLSCAKT